MIRKAFVIVMVAMALALCTTSCKRTNAEEEPKDHITFVRGKVIYAVDVKFGLCFAQGYHSSDSFHSIVCNKHIFAEANRLLGRTTHAKNQ